MNDIKLKIYNNIMGIPEDYFKYTKELYEKYGKEKTIVLIQVGDFFEVYGTKEPDTGEFTGSNIEAFRNELGMRISDKKGVYNEKSLLMAGFPIDKKDFWCSRLHNSGWIVAIYEQDKLLSDGKSYSRVLTEIISPGTYFNFNSDNISNYCSCISINKIYCSRDKIERLYFGMSTIDIYSGTSYLFEYSSDYEKSITPYDELERFIISHKPKQVIFIYNIDDKELDSIIKYISLNNTTIQKYNVNDTNANNIRLKQIENARKPIYQEEILNKFFDNSLTSYSDEYDRYAYATESYCFLLEYAHEHNPCLVDKIMEPVFKNVSERVILANHSLKQLNITCNSDLIESSKNISSVAKFLNKCQTPMGKRLLEHDILNPVNNADILRKKYNMVYIIIHADSEENSIENIRKKLSNIIDIEKLNRKIVKLDATPSDIYNLEKSIDIILTLYKSYVNYLKSTSSGSEIVSEFKKIGIKKRCREYIYSIDNFLDKEKARLVNNLDYDDNFIKKGVNDKHDELILEYCEISAKLDSITKYLNTEMELIARSTGKSMIEIERKKDGTNIIITSARFKKLKTNIDEKSNKEVELFFTNEYDQTDYRFIFNLEMESTPAKKGSVYIRTPEIVAICQRIDVLKEKISNSLRDLYLKFTNDLKEQYKSLQIVSKFIAEFDLNYTKAFLAIKYKYVMPIIDDTKKESFVEAKQLRHPLIENLNNNETYIANDIELNGKQQGVLLFGTNAVGKSSLIKAIGISVIMAQAGFFVSASKFTYNPYKNIFTRILGNDNLFKGLSTFAVEMLELKTILKGADENSLIIGDEVCSGTEVESATSIIVASLIELHQCKSSFIFATHYHEICSYDEVKQLDRMAIKHLSVSLNNKTNTLEYDRVLKDGQGDTFYGLTVAEGYKLPQDILNKAHEIRNKYLHLRDKKQDNILNLKPSRYNSKKLTGGLCEVCKQRNSVDIHHIQYQSNADDNNYIGHIQKNSVGNLISICQECHDKIHKENVENIKIKTTNGTVLAEL